MLLYVLLIVFCMVCSSVAVVVVLVAIELSVSLLQLLQVSSMLCVVFLRDVGGIEEETVAVLVFAVID